MPDKENVTFPKTICALHNITKEIMVYIKNINQTIVIYSKQMSAITILFYKQFNRRF